MVIGLVLAAMVAMGEVNLTAAIILTVVINLFIWLISPWLSDLTLRWFNKLEFLDDAAVKSRYPGVHQLVHQVADEYRFSTPRIGFIPTGTRPPLPTGCFARMPASSLRKASSSS